MNFCQIDCLMLSTLPKYVAFEFACSDLTNIVIISWSKLGTACKMIEVFDRNRISWQSRRLWISGVNVSNSNLKMKNPCLDWFQSLRSETFTHCNYQRRWPLKNTNLFLSSGYDKLFDWMLKITWLVLTNQSSFFSE